MFLSMFLNVFYKSEKTCFYAFFICKLTFLTSMIFSQPVGLTHYKSVRRSTAATPNTRAIPVYLTHAVNAFAVTTSAMRYCYPPCRLVGWFVRSLVSSFVKERSQVK